MVNIARNVLLDHMKKSTTLAVKTASKRAIQKTAEVTSDLIGNQITDKIRNVSRTSPHNNSETIESEIENTGFDKEIGQEKYISPEERQKFIQDLRLMQ